MKINILLSIYKLNDTILSYAPIQDYGTEIYHLINHMDLSKNDFVSVINSLKFEIDNLKLVNITEANLLEQRLEHFNDGFDFVLGTGNAQTLNDYGDIKHSIIEIEVEI